MIQSTTLVLGIYYLQIHICKSLNLFQRNLMIVKLKLKVKCTSGKLKSANISKLTVLKLMTDQFQKATPKQITFELEQIVFYQQTVSCLKRSGYSALFSEISYRVVVDFSDFLCLANLQNSLFKRSKFTTHVFSKKYE